MEKQSNVNGIIVVNKPKGLTSRDVVNKIGRLLGTKKVGHTGTLDPLATGVLVVTIGKYTKLSDALMSEYKTYKATFILGYETDTLDITGKKVNSSEITVTNKEIEECISSFKGTYLQEVPYYSAVKVNGRRLYDYARSGVSVELPKREVEIKNITILDIDGPNIEIECTVSKGTYIRSLIRDIGHKLNTYAVMSSLERTKQGDFKIEESYTLEDIEEGNYKLLSAKDVLKDLTVTACNENKKQIENGVALTLPFKTDYVLFKEENEDIALYQNNDNEYKMFIKF